MKTFEELPVEFRNMMMDRLRYALRKGYFEIPNDVDEETFLKNSVLDAFETAESVEPSTDFLP